MCVCVCVCVCACACVCVCVCVYFGSSAVTIVVLISGKQGGGQRTELEETLMRNQSVASTNTSKC